MANNQIQVPPPVGSSGQHLDAIVISSSEMRQVVVVGDPTSTGNLLAMDGSGRITVNQASAARNLTSGVVTLSSAPTVNVSSGVITLSSAPSLSSGTVTLSSTPFFSLVGTSSAPAVVTSSGGLQVSIVAGAGAGSTAINLSVVSAAGFAPVTSSAGLLVSVSSGLITLSSNPTVVSASSGLIQLTSAISLSSGIVTLSSTPTTVSASSGTVGTIVSTAQTWTVFNINASSSNSITSVSTGAHILYGWNVGNQTTGLTAAIKIYDSTAPTAGSTSGFKLTIPIPGSTGGAGNNLMLKQGVSFATGIAFTITQNYATTSTGVAHAAGDVVGTLYYV